MPDNHSRRLVRYDCNSADNRIGSMTLRLRAVVTSLKQRVLWFRRRSRPRDLMRELREQFTEDYWHRRARAQSRRHWVVSQRYRLAYIASIARNSIVIINNSFLSILKSFSIGGLLIASLLSIETALAHFAAPQLLLAEELAQTLGAFPTLAVQISASLLGFYLASVSIVLGNAYDDVSADVRTLVLGNARTRLYLASIGLAIGAGLTLVLLQSFAFSFGYLTIIAYALLVVFSGWAFSQLAFGAFNLFNPIVLGEEPLQALYQAIGRIDSKGLLGDEAVLQAASQEANRALGTLAHLIDLTSKRGSVDRPGLVHMIEYLLVQLQFYAQKKHLLTPASAWFPREPAYPKWVESDYTETMLALETSTPLRPHAEPMTDWLERRSADLASAALETCVRANDRDAALRIITAVASTAKTLARYYRFDDARIFSGVVRERCWSIQCDNAAATVVALGPPLILGHMLLGWREAIAAWGEEIQRAVSSTDWDRMDTTIVRIRGPVRVWTTAQRLLRETQTEYELDGHRTTPNWYLHLPLADACIITIRESAKDLPGLLKDCFTGPYLTRSSPTVKAANGGQALQALAKADLVAQDIPRAVADLECLRKPNDPLPAGELGDLPENIRTLRSQVLERIAETIIELQPDSSSSEPDLFGQSLFTLVHHMEQAIASGDASLIKRIFPNVLAATMVLEEHVLVTYGQQIHEYNPALFDPVVDLLEISGLAVIYEVIRDDCSADPVRKAWDAYIHSFQQSEDAAKRILNVLDATHIGMPLGLTPRYMVRSAWEQRLEDAIVKAGYAYPDYSPVDENPDWSAPPLLKLLSVSASLPSVSHHPRVVFAAEVMAPLSGESDDELRGRPALQRYFDERDHLDYPPGTGDT